MDIFINGKKYSKIERLPVNKLEHLIQLNDDEIVRYKRVIQNYPKERMESHGLPFLKILEARKTSILDLIKDKMNA